MTGISIPQLAGIAGFALAAAALAMGLVAGLAGRRRWRVLVGLVAATVVCVPAGGIPVAGYLRGIFGDLSITSLLLLGAAVFRAVSGRSLLDEGTRIALCAWCVPAGLALYPQALGLTRVDPYELGLRPRALVVVLAVVTLWWWWRQRRAAALVLAGGVGAFNLRVLESSNLWDYVLDPYLFAVATVYVVLRARARTRVRAWLRWTPPRPAAAVVQPRAAAEAAGRESDAITGIAPRDGPVPRDGPSPTAR